jgi:hypothetical protein
MRVEIGTEIDHNHAHNTKELGALKIRNMATMRDSDVITMNIMFMGTLSTEMDR